MRKTLNVASQIIAIVDALYQIVDALQSDFNNLYKAMQVILIDLLQELQTIIISLASTGIYMLPVLPDFKSGVKGVVKPGGFDAVLAKVQQKLVDPLDPNRPTFSDKDAVGGVLAVLTAGTNVGDLINNLDALGNFIKNFSVDQPGLGAFTAVPGLYVKGAIPVPPVMHPGVRLTWKPAHGLYQADTYLITRCRVSGGVPDKYISGKDANGGDVWSDTLGRDGKPVKIFYDPDFNGGKPVTLHASLISSMKYDDFEVVEGTTYFYKVRPVINGQVSEGLSKEAHATVVTCIPDSAVSQFLETPNGLKVGPNNGEKPDWQNISLKGLIGPALDEAFKSLVRLVGTLNSITNTASDAFNDLLNLMKHWIKQLQALLAKINAVLQALAALKFTGGAAIVKVDPDFSKGGGITRLSRMITSATMSNDMKTDMEQNSGLCAITAALFIVVGVPSADTFSLTVPPADKAKFESAKAMGATKADASKAWDMISTLFGGSGGGTSASASKAASTTTGASHGTVA
jgi:hypothetical protein